MSRDKKLLYNLTMKSQGKPENQVPLWYLYATLFMGGLATMAVEFAASRLLGNVFGTSNLVWAVVIGLVLVYLTVGSWLGGKWADRSPKPGTFYLILALAGASVALIPMISPPVLRIAADAFDALNMPLLAGTFTAVLLLLLVPVTLLGTITPFGLKLMISDTTTTGKVTGGASAVSTVGSFIGTFLTVLVLIPVLGTRRTFFLISAVLLLTAAIGFLFSRKFLLAVLAFILMLAVLALEVFGLAGPIKQTTGMIHESESAYNYIQVLEDGKFRFLRLNEGQGMHSIYHPTQLYYAGPWSQMLVGYAFNPGEPGAESVKNIAILGLAAGTTARQALSALPNAHVDGYEIDPEIISVGEQYFGMDLPNLTTYAEDARWGIVHSAETYDLISVDAYRPPYIPPHMVTVEFFAEIARKLSPTGVVAVNVGRSPGDHSLVDAMSSTMAQVFPHVFVSDLPDSYNTIIFGARSVDADWKHFESEAQKQKSAEENGLLALAMQATLAGKVQPVTTGLVFTDDKAPIEFITNKMVLEFVFGGGAIENEIHTQ